MATAARGGSIFVDNPTMLGNSCTNYWSQECLKIAAQMIGLCVFMIGRITQKGVNAQLFFQSC